MAATAGCEAWSSRILLRTFMVWATELPEPHATPPYLPELSKPFCD
jgi:hypothetical protein